jgi:hypothetical protein
MPRVTSRKLSTVGEMMEKMREWGHFLLGKEKLWRDAKGSNSEKDSA